VKAVSRGVLPDLWRWTAMIAALALIGVVMAWQWVPDRTMAALIVGIVLCLPALAPIPGIAFSHRYTFKWATLCVTPYFVVGLTETVANPAHRTWAAAVLGLSLLWFVALVAFLRVSRDRQPHNG
jgi:uncharacterized membrane protein